MKSKFTVLFVRLGGTVGVWTKYYRDVSDRECQPGTGQSSSKTKAVTVKQKEAVDVETFVKMVSTWIVGGFVSLMPIFTSLLSENELVNWKNVQIAVSKVFESPELFLVITTLTISCLCEMVYDNNRKGIKKKLLVLIEAMLIIFSIHWFTLLDNEVLGVKNPYIGLSTLVVCLLVCLVGYFVISKKRGKRNGG